MSKTCLAALLVVVLPSTVNSQTLPAFDDFFTDAALRVEVSFVGDAKQEWITLDHVVEEPVWPASTTTLIDPFGYGRYMVELYDTSSNRLIYSRGFDLMFGEYTTTAPAIAGVKRTFAHALRVPRPKHPVLFVIAKRDKKNLLRPAFSQILDPTDYHVIKETAKAGDHVFEVMVNGEPHCTVDLVFVAEGYTAQDKAKFEADARRAADWLFEVEPYNSLKSRFSVRGVMRPSPEPAMDEPRQGVYKKTLLNASFNAFDTDRYQLTEEGRLLREIAAQVPYDTIVVLTNSKRYGGGGIYNDYAITTVDNERSKAVLVHEFGHSFAGLADEYYASDVAYNDLYPEGVEPLEPNITRYLNPARLKWRDLLAPGIALPTDWGKEKVEALQAEMRKTGTARREEIEKAKAGGASEAQLTTLAERHAAARKDLEARMNTLRSLYAPVADKVGLFEGAAYTNKGMYRPAMHCLMISNPKNEFCPVCQRAIRRMIEYYSWE